MIRLRQEERKKLWRIYPEVQALFEEYNDILLEDDTAWKTLDQNCTRIYEQYQKSDVIKTLLLDLVKQLEQIAGKRRG